MGSTGSTFFTWVFQCCNSLFTASATEVVNELISMMGQSVLRKLLCNIKRVTPHWFGIIADEATDVSNREQLNLSIRWVNDNWDLWRSCWAFHTPKHKCKHYYWSNKGFAYQVWLTSPSMLRTGIWQGSYNARLTKRGCKLTFVVITISCLQQKWF